MFSINPQDKSPLYQQIMEQLILFISNGILAPGEKLPSIRELASDLGINPNTVVRAYNELERRNIIATYPKRGTFVLEGEHAMQERVEESAYEIMLEACQKVWRLGLEASVVERIFKEAMDNVDN